MPKFPLKFEKYLSANESYLIKKICLYDIEEPFNPNLDLFVCKNGIIAQPNFIFKNCSFRDNIYTGESTMVSEFFPPVTQTYTHKLIIVDVFTENDVEYTVYQMNGTEFLNSNSIKGLL